MAFYRSTVFGHLENGETWNITLHLLDVGGVAATIAADVATAVTAMWSGTNSPAGNLHGIYKTTIGVDGVKVDELSALGKNVAQSITALSLVGTASDESLPPNVAIGVSLRTALPTKAGRGRFSLPSPVITTVVGQKIDTTVQTAVKNAALAYINSIRADGHTPVIYHRGFDAGDEVTQVDVGDIFDSQNPRRHQLIETRVRSNVT
jgi:hypothetical protein